VLDAGFAEVPPSDTISAAVAELAKGYDYVVAVSSLAAKDLLARVAGHLDWPLVNAVTAIRGSHEFQHPVAAGAAVATVRVSGDGVILTFRPAAFPGAAPAGESTKESVSLAVEPGSRRTEAAARSGSRPDLAQAKVIVSGGRPLQTAEKFEQIIGGLADALGGAVGATRAAVDSGIASNELQVGQTGKIVAPDLYIAAGISGSTQHLAGIKDSKVIVAINKDPGAPIFEVADFGLVADLFEAVPELTAQIQQRAVAL
jgi:electron transfer flavoprotein alpha subunit